MTLESKSNGLLALLEIAQKVRSVEACNKVRVAVVELGNKERNWQANLLAAQGLQYIVQELMLLSLKIGTEYKDSDPIKAQEFWTIALSVSNDLRCQQMGVMKMLNGPIGKNNLHRWPNSCGRMPFAPKNKSKFLNSINSFFKKIFTQNQMDPKSIDSSRSIRRGIRSDIFEKYSEWVSYTPKDEGGVIYQEEKFITFPPRPPLENFIVVTYSLLKDDLVIFIDTKLSEFIYKDGFADYAYTPEKVLPTPYACPPIHIKKVRQSIVKAVENLYNDNSEIDFKNNLKTISNLLAIPTINDAISDWCKQKGIAENDINLIFIPEGFLHRVPFGFLRASIGTESQLFNKFASVTTALSSLALKWQIQTYIYRCLPFVKEGIPRCVFFGVPKSSLGHNLDYLDGVLEEWKLICSTFGTNRVLAFGDEPDSQLLASIENLATYHHDAEIFWYAGHGWVEKVKRVDERTDLEARPRMAFILPNQLLTLESFYRGKPWNFSRNWMVILNSCFLGQLTMKGTELEGFLSALYLTGASAVVSCLWPVNDSIAPVFAQKFSEHLKNAYNNKMILTNDFFRAKAFAFKNFMKDDELQKYYLSNNFIRAKAFTECMRSLIKDGYDEKTIACYFYCGSP